MTFIYWCLVVMTYYIYRYVQRTDIVLCSSFAVIEMQAPSEVWERIISNFRIYLSKDDVDTVRAKKCTLLTLALTHPKLTDIALDEHWKSMLSLRPIVNVVSHKYNDKSYDHEMDDMIHCWVS